MLGFFLLELTRDCDIAQIFETIFYSKIFLDRGFLIVYIEPFWGCVNLFSGSKADRSKLNVLCMPPQMAS